MKDRNFLNWLANTIEQRYEQEENADFLYKLRAIANSIPEDQESNWSRTEPEVHKLSNYIVNMRNGQRTYSVSIDAYSSEAATTRACLVAKVRTGISGWYVINTHFKMSFSMTFGS